MFTPTSCNHAMPCHWSLLAVLPQCWIKLPQQSSTEKRHHVFHSHSKPCKIIQNHSSYHRSTHGHSKPSETARSCPSIKYLPKQSVKHTRKTTVSAQWPKQVAQVHQHDNLQKSVHLNRGFGMLRIASDGFGLLTLCKMDRTWKNIMEHWNTMERQHQKKGANTSPIAQPWVMSGVCGILLIPLRYPLWWWLVSILQWCIPGFTIL